MAGGRGEVIRATYEGGDRLVMHVRGHALFADQPVADGGTDTAPTPTELFLAGLAGCILFYAERFLNRHHLSVEGLNVALDYSWAERPHRVGAIEVDVRAPALTDAHREAFSRVVGHCTVHNTISTPPSIRLRVNPVPSIAA